MLSLQSWRWRCKPASHTALRRGLALLPKLHSLQHLIPEAAGAVAGTQRKEAATLGPAPSFVRCLTVALCFYGGPGLLCTPLLAAVPRSSPFGLSPHGQPQSSPQVCSLNPSFSTQPPRVPTGAGVSRWGAWRGGTWLCSHLSR